MQTKISTPENTAPATTKKDVVAESVAQDCLVLFRKAQAKYINSQRSGFHVSDYIYECMRKTALTKMAEESNAIGGMSMEMMSILYVGQAIHHASNLNGVAHELSFCYDIVNDKAIPFDDQGKPKIPEGRPQIDFLVGTLDDMAFNETINGNIIIDKKTVAYKGYTPRSASDHHKEQTNLYRLLLNKCKKMDALWGCNLYIDISERTEKIYPFAYRLYDVATTLKKLKDRRQEILNWHETGELPDRVITWACNYCSQAFNCFKEND